MFQGKKQLGTVETGSLFVEALFTLQVMEQLSSVDKSELRINSHAGVKTL